MYSIKLILGQGRAGITQKTLKFPISQLLDKPKQPQLLPGRRPIIQIPERPLLQQPQYIIQPKTTPNNFNTRKLNISESSQIEYKVIPVPNYIIPQTRFGGDSISRTIKRKTMQDTRREIPAYADPIYRHPSKPTETPFQKIPRKLMDFDTGINTEFEENSPYQEGVISEMCQRPNRSFFQEPPRIEKSSEYRQASAKVFT